MSDIEERLKKVTHILLDVDGTLTDGSLFFDKDGNELKAFFARDGSRMTLALKAGLKIFFITGRVSPVVEARARNRKISGVLNKKDLPNESLALFFEREGITKDAVLYLGDDLNDIPFLRQVGIKAAVADAAPEVLALADIVTKLPGGRGAAGELLELVLRSQRRWDNLVTNL